MKVQHLITIILFLNIFCYSYAQPIRKLEVRFVNINIETPYDIHCQDFENSFGPEIRIINIDDKSEIKKFSTILDSLKVNNEINRPDVRIKIIIHSKRNKVLCMDRFSLSIGNKSYNYSKDLMEFVLNIIDKVGSSNSKDQ